MACASFQQKITSGVEVSVVQCSAHRTRPLAIRQGQVRLDMAADVTPFGRREEGPDGLDLTAVPHAFVLQLAQELPPPGIADSLGQVVIGEQPLHLQVFNKQRLVFARQSVTLLV